MYLLATVLHPYVTGCVRLIGSYLGEDSESFASELLDVLPFIFKLQPLRDAETQARTRLPESLRAPLCLIIPALVIRTVESEFLSPFSSAFGPETLAAWTSRACVPLLLSLAEERVVASGKYLDYILPAYVLLLS